MATSIPISTKEFRDNLAEILEQVAVGGKSYEIQKFGKTKAFLSPNISKKKSKKVKFKELKSFGMWKDRKDMVDPVAWVNNSRRNEEESRRSR